jgi:hypothetical protein
MVVSVSQLNGHALCKSIARNAALNNQPGRNHLMKKIIVTIACCALLGPLAFAKDQQGKNSKQTRAWHFAFITERPVTVTAPNPGARIEGGAAASYQPANTLLVHQDGPGRYVLDGSGHVFNSKGEAVRSGIKPGTPVHIYFGKDEAGMHTIDHVVVD